MRFADTVGKMVNQIVPEMENMPQLAPALAETFMLVLRSFKIGRSTEVAFQEAMDNIAKIADAPKQPKTRLTSSPKSKTIPKTHITKQQNCHIN